MAVSKFIVAIAPLPLPQQQSVPPISQNPQPVLVSSPKSPQSAAPMQEIPAIAIGVTDPAANANRMTPGANTKLQFHIPLQTLRTSRTKASGVFVMRGEKLVKSASPNLALLTPLPHVRHQARTQT